MKEIQEYCLSKNIKHETKEDFVAIYLTNNLFIVTFDLVYFLVKNPSDFHTVTEKFNTTEDLIKYIENNS